MKLCSIGTLYIVLYLCVVGLFGNAWQVAARPDPVDDEYNRVSLPDDNSSDMSAMNETVSIRGIHRPAAVIHNNLRRNLKQSTVVDRPECLTIKGPSPAFEVSDGTGNVGLAQTTRRAHGVEWPETFSSMQQCEDACRRNIDCDGFNYYDASDRLGSEDCYLMHGVKDLRQSVTFSCCGVTCDGNQCEERKRYAGLCPSAIATIAQGIPIG